MSKTLCDLVDHLEEGPDVETAAGPAVAVPPGGARQTTVVLRQGLRARLRADDPKSAARVELMKRLREFRRPVLVRAADDDTAEDVQIPLVGRVTDFAEVEGGDLSVEIETSAARRILKRDVADPVRRTLLERSRTDGVLLAFGHHPFDHTIHWLNEAPAEAAPIFPALSTDADREIPVDAVGEVDLADANDLFAVLEGKSCGLEAQAPGCIPFLYPDDGCFSRAHAMCRLIEQHGFTPGKLWLFGTLAPSTPNDPDCRADWNFHVAPVVRLRGTTKLLVLDPALFNAPVKRSLFVQTMKSSNVTQKLTSDEVFLRSKVGGARPENPPADDGRTETEEWLDLHRMQLRQREPPPPFQCG